ncbi:MAG: 30S ribosome-binding factor RbfA [Firmicutes bacterium]|nr:30S ribosome-binding factor RbfA [Bacillota bacterium]
MAYHRIDRISEEIRKEISDIIRTEVKDPRIASMSTIIKAEVTKDLRHAKIYVSVLGSDEEKNSTIEGFKKASGYIRRELGTRMDIHYIPELHFELDTSIEYSIQISKKLDELHLNQEEKDVD